MFLKPQVNALTSSYPGLDKVSTCGNLTHIVSHWEDLTKSQDMPKFQFSRGGGYSETEK